MGALNVQNGRDGYDDLLANIRRLTVNVLDNLEAGTKDRTLDQGQKRLLSSTGARLLRLWPLAIFPSVTILGPSASIALEQFHLASGQSNSTSVRVSTTNSTQPGNYTIAIGMSVAFGVASHTIILPLVVFPPAAAPVLVQFHWRHLVQLSKPGHDKGGETFDTGIWNPNNSTLIYAQVKIAGVEENSRIRFTIVSAPFKLLQGQSILNIQLSVLLSQLSTGHFFTVTATILWGMNRNFLNLSSDRANVPDAGSFSVRF